MTVHLHHDLDELHRELLATCAKVEDMVRAAAELLVEFDYEAAAEFADRDRAIDQAEVAIEESCLKLLALHQPVAVDLRRLTAVMKISGELERVADLSVNIAERSIGVAEATDLQVPDQIVDMATIAIDMLHESIDAYVAWDSARARTIRARDDRVDELNVAVIDRIRRKMHSQPADLDPLLHLFSATRQIERVADHATNIAEDVVYLVEGEIIRHQPRLPVGGGLADRTPRSPLGAE